MNLEDLVKRSLKIISAEFPFLSKVINSLEIYISDEVMTIAITPDLKIYINPNITNVLKEGINENDQRILIYRMNFVLLHEIFHAVFGHVYARINPLKNIAMDAEVNDTLLDLKKTFPLSPPPNIVTYYTIAKNYEIQISTGEPWEFIYNKLRKNVRNCSQCRFGSCSSKNMDTECPFESKYVLSGDIISRPIKGERKIYEGKERRTWLGNKIESESDYRKIKDLLEETFMRMLHHFKQAGTIPGSLIERVKIEKNIENILSNIKSMVLGLNYKIYERSYTADNRRDSNRPGYLKGDYPTVIFAVDVSGSLPGEIIGKLLGIISEYDGPVIIIQWDAEVQRVEYYFPGRNLPDKIDVTGRGGTIMSSALKLIKKAIEDRYLETYSGAKAFDSEVHIIVGSDFYITDPEESRQLIEEISKQSKVYLVTSGENPKNILGELKDVEVYDLSTLAARYR